MKAEARGSQCNYLQVSALLSEYEHHSQANSLHLEAEIALLCGPLPIPGPLVLPASHSRGKTSFSLAPAEVPPPHTHLIGQIESRVILMQTGGGWGRAGAEFKVKWKMPEVHPEHKASLGEVLTLC